MMQKPLSILISGAGVAGTSLAFMLARNPSLKTRARITLVERSPIVRTTGQAVDIRGPAVNVIRNLGIEPAIKAKHTGETGIAFLNGHGTIIGQFDATGDAEKQGITSEYEILRADLVGLLMDGINQAKQEKGNIDIIYDERIQSLDDQAEGVVVDFTNDKLQKQKFDVVIAADGISSKFPSMVFGKEQESERIKPSGMYIGWFTIPRIPEDDQLYRWCIVPGGLSMHLRPHNNQNTMGCYLSIMNGTKASLPELEEVLRQDIVAQKAYLYKRFRNVGWQSERFLKGLDQADDFYLAHWCMARTSQWTKGRCAILGDTAFATMGVGTSLAMVGAYTLAGELSKMATSEDVPTALKRYENILRPFIAKHESEPYFIPQILSPQSPFRVGLLHTAMWIASKSRLHKLLASFFGDDDYHGLVLPDYGWKKRADGMQSPT